MLHLTQHWAFFFCFCTLPQYYFKQTKAYKELFERLGYDFKPYWVSINLGIPNQNITFGWEIFFNIQGRILLKNES